MRLYLCRFLSEVSNGPSEKNRIKTAQTSPLPPEWAQDTGRQSTLKLLKESQVSYMYKRVTFIRTIYSIWY